MPVKVRIPTPLRKFTNNEADVEIDADSINALLDGLESQFGGIKERLCDDTGKLRRFINVYVNEEDIRFQDGQATALKDGDEIAIVPAIAGG